MLTSVKWIYPLNWDGEYPGEGDPVPSERTRGWKRMVVQLDGYSDVSQEGDDSGVKIVRANLYGVEGKPCYKIGITKVEYSTYGCGVHLYWSMTPDQTICRIPQSEANTICGPFLPEVTEPGGYGPAEFGDVVLTTNSMSQYDSYNITLYITVKERPQSVAAD